MEERNNLRINGKANMTPLVACACSFLELFRFGLFFAGMKQNIGTTNKKRKKGKKGRFEGKAHVLDP